MLDLWPLCVCMCVEMWTCFGLYGWKGRYLSRSKDGAVDMLMCRERGHMFSSRFLGGKGSIWCRFVGVRSIYFALRGQKRVDLLTRFKRKRWISFSPCGRMGAICCRCVSGQVDFSRGRKG